MPEFTVDEVLEGQSTLEALGATWGLHHVPGHSPDSLCFHLAAQNLLFGGDVLFLDGIGRTDFPRGDLDTLLMSITTRLWPLGDDVTFVPGHGPTSTFGEERRSNPYVGDGAMERRGG